MLIVVEGLDRTGKTSLIERCAAPGDRVIHWERPTKRPWEEYVEPLLDYRPGSGENVWCDRHYLGELVWPCVFDRPTEMTRIEQARIELFLHSRGALCIWAFRPVDEIIAACDADDEPVRGQGVRLAHRLFKREVERSALDWWYYRHGDSMEYKLQVAHDREDAAKRPVAPVVLPANEAATA